MINAILNFSVRQRLLVLLAALILAGSGWLSLRQIPIDAFPDVTNVQVQVLATAGGLAGILLGLWGQDFARQLIPWEMQPLAESAGGLTEDWSRQTGLPAGIPVATMAIGKAGAKNAALFAVQILALSEPKLTEELLRYRVEMDKELEQKDADLQAR